MWHFSYKFILFDIKLFQEEVSSLYRSVLSILLRNVQRCSILELRTNDHAVYNIASFDWLISRHYDSMYLAHSMTVSQNYDKFHRKSTNINKVAVRISIIFYISSTM